MPEHVLQELSAVCYCSLELKLKRKCWVAFYIWKEFDKLNGFFVWQRSEHLGQFSWRLVVREFVTE